MEYSNLFVCLMGICTVFIGLICIILLVTVMSNIVRLTDRKMKRTADGSPVGASAVQRASAAAGAGAAAGVSAGRTASAGSGEVTAELAAAVSAVIAEEMGTDVSGIRIVSFKKVSA